MSQHTDTNMKEALAQLGEATSRLAHSLVGAEPTAHLKKSMQHAILAATSSIEQLNERMASCREGSACPKDADTSSGTAHAQSNEPADQHENKPASE